MAVSTAPASSPITAQHSKFSGSNALVSLIKYALLLLLGFTFVLPFIWMVSSALKDDPQVFTIPPIWLPNPMYWENFPNAWLKYDFTRFTFNTVFLYGLPATIGTVLSSAFVAYGFSRIKWPGRDIIFAIMMGTLMIPYAVTMVPLFIIFKNLGWLNSYWPLVVPMFFGNPWSIFLLRQFYRGIPNELSEATKIDGSSEIGILFRIILPLAGPVLTVIALFTFIGTWNDYLAPLIYLNKTEMYPIALGVNLLRQAAGQTGTTALVYPHLMAVSTIVTIPVVVAFYFAQRTFIEGVAVTGLKG
jgi:ABC-type glycerol-3-phosphate transport system permease component